MYQKVNSNIWKGIQMPDWPALNSSNGIWKRNNTFSVDKMLESSNGVSSWKSEWNVKYWKCLKKCDNVGFLHIPSIYLNEQK